MKPHAAAELAKRLTAEFGSLSAVLAASPAALGRAIGSEPKAIRFIGKIREAMLCAARQSMATAPVLSDMPALLDYLVLAMADLPQEQVRILFVDAKNRLLHDEVIAVGTVDEVTIHPREILRRALELGAVGLIVAHNHPSGDPQPSRGDITATRRLIDAARALDIVVHDHVIVTRTGHASIRATGLV